jgi:hypothetical protein
MKRKRRSRVVTVPPVPSIEPKPPLIDDAFITAYSNKLFAELIAGLGGLIGGGSGAAPAAPTRTLGFNYSAAIVLSWKSDANYRIIGVFGGGVSNAAMVNFGGQTYAAITAPVGVHLEWIAYSGTNSVIYLNVPIVTGQILYCSAGGAGTTHVSLVYSN